MQTIDMSVDAVTVENALLDLSRTWSGACAASAERVGAIAGHNVGTHTQLSAARVTVERSTTAAAGPALVIVANSVFASTTVRYGANHAANGMAVSAGQPAVGVGSRPRGTPLR